MLRVNAEFRRAGYEGSGRRPFQGGVDQIVRDLEEYAEIGLEEILLDLQGTARDAAELTDVAAEVFEKARAAGV